eukprot:COSAG04_NODE_20922_length_383_cov_1.049296_1_plen_104_part_01
MYLLRARTSSYHHRSTLSRYVCSNLVTEGSVRSEQVPDGQQDGGPWKATKDALAPSLEGLKDKAAALKAKVSGNEAEVVTALADGLLESANASMALRDSEYAEL